MSILVTGSTAYDFLLGYDGLFADSINPNALDKLSVSYFTPHFARHHGGTGANIAWNLKLLGQDPLLVSTVGSDGGAYTALFEERGIKTDLMERLEDYMTAMAIIGTDSGEHQIAFYHPGADSFGSWPKSIDDRRDDVSYAIISPRDARLMMEAAAWCREYGVPYLFDPGQQIPALGEDDLRRMTEESAGLIVNDYEWSLISDRLKLTREEMLAHTPLIVITKGEHGLEIVTREGKRELDACYTDGVVNPTGAGDALRAGLLTGLSLDWSIVDAGRLGAAMGSFAVESEGTLMDNLDMNILAERIQKAYGASLPSL